ncbi:peptidase, M20/M25/M40 family [Ancylostoma ceylanicum]|uniref:Peptidase, M20/M25/M40 family n=1 Tax=Ancylostoma ceylanicum TaxID=53326 RepID=A0A0D6LT78_9BILA|nr:peptidase, M20/M25/M40 family [Ancylostoma ceylanicum]
MLNIHRTTTMAGKDFGNVERLLMDYMSVDSTTENEGQMACMVSAAQTLVDSHPEVAEQIALLFVVGEEVDHVGMQKANEFTTLQPEYLVVGEPTELKFATIQKGATTINIGIIEGGQAQNAWAESAYARIFVRVTTSVADVQKKLEDIVAGRASIEVTSYNEPVVLSNPPLPYPTDQVAFNTDLPYYSRLSSLKGKYLFGAGTIKVAHSQREFVPKSELHACKDALIALVLKLCS